MHFFEDIRFDSAKIELIEIFDISSKFAGLSDSSKFHCVKIWLKSNTIDLWFN